MDRRLSFAVACIGLAGLAAGCIFNDDDNNPTEVTKEVEIPVDFTIDGDKLCQQASDLDCENPENEQAQQSYPLGTFEVDRDVDIVEKTGRDELEDLSGRFKRITVSKIEYKYKDNNLTFTAPALNFDVGPLEAESRNNEDVVRLTTLPKVPPGENKEGTADVPEENEEAASPYFKQLELSVIPNGDPKVEEGDELPPSGTADVETTIFVKFVADAADQLN